MYDTYYAGVSMKKPRKEDDVERKEYNGRECLPVGACASRESCAHGMQMHSLRLDLLIL